MHAMGAMRHSLLHMNSTNSTCYFEPMHCTMKNGSNCTPHHTMHYVAQYFILLTRILWLNYLDTLTYENYIKIKFIWHITSKILVSFQEKHWIQKKIEFIWHITSKILVSFQEKKKLNPKEYEKK